MLIVRRATRRDVQEIARIATAGRRHAYRSPISAEAIDDTLQRSYSEEMLLRRLAGQPLHVADSAGKVAGYVQHNPIGDSIHEVNAIYVDPALLGRGTG